MAGCIVWHILILIPSWKEPPQPDPPSLPGCIDLLRRAPLFRNSLATVLFRKLKILLMNKIVTNFDRICMRLQVLVLDRRLLLPPEVREPSQIKLLTTITAIQRSTCSSFLLSARHTLARVLPPPQTSPWLLPDQSASRGACPEHQIKNYCSHAPIGETLDLGTPNKLFTQ